MDNEINFKKRYINTSRQKPLPCGSTLHIPPANHHRLAVQQETYKKAQILTKKCLNIFW